MHPIASVRTWSSRCLHFGMLTWLYPRTSFALRLAFAQGKTAWWTGSGLQRQGRLHVPLRAGQATRSPSPVAHRVRIVERLVVASTRRQSGGSDAPDGLEPASFPGCVPNLEGSLSNATSAAPKCGYWQLLL